MTDITDYLMKQADLADRAADELLEEAAKIQSSLEVHFASSSGDQFRAARLALEERASFHRGQASGFRQSTFMVTQFLGTPTHD